MKKTNNIKILVLVISLALLVCGIVGITVSAQTENSSDPAVVNADASLSIYKKNVSFQNSPQLVFAVAYENCEAADITLDVWYGEKSGEAQSVASFGNVTIGGESYPAFAVEPADPKDIDKLVYVQAKVGEVLSEVERYSILEFAWSGIMTAETDEAAADYYNIIDYSKSVQKWLAGKFDGTPVDNYFYVKAEGVALDASGYDSGVFTAPVTFTLGESELGWNVTTYVDGAKITETKAAGNEITASASTICTKISGAESFKPQDVEGTPIDFESTSVNSSGNGGAGTAYFVGSAALSTSKKGATETLNKNGNTTTAYYFDSDSGTTDNLRIQSYGNDTDDKVGSANAFVFDSDMRLDYADSTTFSTSAVRFYLGNTNKDSSTHCAYYLVIYLDDTTKTLKIADLNPNGMSEWVTTDVKSGEWFNFRLEYYKVSADTILALVYINEELVFVSNSIRTTNAYGDDAWPVYAESFTASDNSSYKGINAVRLEAASSTDVTVYLDNTLMRRTNLTVPSIPENLYDSFYTPAN